MTAPRDDLTPAVRSLQARRAAHLSWANTANRTARTAAGLKAARTAMDARFERQVDPDGVLPAAERRQRAANARKAYFIGLALKSAQARARRRVS